MLPGFDLAQFAASAGPIAAVLLVVAIIFAENGLLVGFFLPGDSILFTLGILISGSDLIKIDFNIHLAVFLLFCASVIGSGTGYYIGKKVGPKLFSREESRFFKKENVTKAQNFYEKHGGKTIILARFVPVVRTFVPLIAGIGKMNFGRFMLYNIIGGAMWICGVTYGAYALGGFLTSRGIDVDLILLPAIACIIFISALPAIYQVLKDKDQREAIKKAIKSKLHLK
jgi:membrane-associated protein